MGLLRFGVKVGILGGTVYYTRQIGVWDDSAKTYQIAREVMNYCKPYLKVAVHELQAQYPAVQELPTVGDMNRCAATYWNKGVIKSVEFVTNVPCMLTHYISEGSSYVVNKLRKEKSSAPPNKSAQNS